MRIEPAANGDTVYRFENVDKWTCEALREMEDCVFRLLSDDPHCAFCGRQIKHSTQQHPGPEVIYRGSFVSPTKIELEPPRTIELVLTRTEGGDLALPTPVVITTASPRGDGWEYGFEGRLWVGYAQTAATSGG